MFLDDISDYLSSQGGWTAGTNLFKGRLPANPDEAVCLYETGGMATVHAMNGSAGQAKVEQPRLQVVSRAATYAAARANAQKAWLLLDGMPTRTINGVSYHWSRVVQSPFTLGRDESGDRTLAVFNVDVFKEMSSTS